MLLKVGVNFEPDISLREALKVGHEVFKTYNELFIITSLKDREHEPGSLHYYGKAYDCRIRHVSDPDKLERIYSSLATALYPRFNVLRYPTHFHIEVDEK